MRRIPVLLACLAATIVSAAHPSLSRRLQTASADELVQVYVLLDEQADRAALRRDLRQLGQERRRRAVIDELRAVAARSQAPLLDRLDAARSVGDAGRVRPLWLANLLIAEVKPRVALELVDHPAVRTVLPVRRTPRAVNQDVRHGDRAARRLELDNLELIGAPEVWQLGHRGHGVVVANVDTGSDYEHGDLAGHIWTNWAEVPDNGIDDDGNGYVDDIVGWNFEDDDAEPRGNSFDDHGTSTAGIVCGDGTFGIRTGVAPGAVLMTLQACTEDTAMEAFQYAAAMGAHVITSSCSYKFPAEPAYAVWREIAESELAIGLVHVNSIGNQGRFPESHPIPYNISAPGNSPPPWLHPEQPTVGGRSSIVATGAVRLDLSQYIDSGRGPVAWEDIQLTYPEQQPIPTEMQDYPWDGGAAPGLVKPEVVMPTFVTTLQFGGGYTSNFGGTSAATPHTAGVAALMLTAAPTLSPEAITEALMTTATDLGEVGLDNDYGAGLVDALAAVESILPEVTPRVRPWGQELLPGAALALDLGLIVNVDTPLDVVVRGDVYLPDGTPFAGNPVLGPLPRTLPAGGARWRSVELPGVPSSEPGRYVFDFRVEDTSQNLINRKEVIYVVR